MDEGGSVDEASLFLKRLRGGGAPSLGILVDMLRKSPDTGISLHGGPLPGEGNLVCAGTLIVEKRRALVVGAVGHHSVRDSIR